MKGSAVFEVEGAKHIAVGDVIQYLLGGRPLFFVCCL